MQTLMAGLSRGSGAGDAGSGCLGAVALGFLAWPGRFFFDICPSFQRFRSGPVGGWPQGAFLRQYHDSLVLDKEYVANSLPRPTGAGGIKIKKMKKVLNPFFQMPIRTLKSEATGTG
ncbi:hypothetical protein AAU61_05430 [Desulfocarbo indianensis]|nr:hypothetical protein AAU61_05430 [Desulfocarbo indianensis]